MTIEIRFDSPTLRMELGQIERKSVITFSQLICHQTELSLAPNRSEKCNYNPIFVRLPTTENGSPRRKYLTAEEEPLTH